MDSLYLLKKIVKEILVPQKTSEMFFLVKTFSKGLNVKKLVFSWTVWTFRYFAIICFTAIFYVWRVFQFVRTYYLKLAYFVSYTYLWNHYKYMTVYLIFFFIYLFLVVSYYTKITNFCLSSQQTSSLKLLTMSLQQGKFVRRDYKKTKKMAVISREIIFSPSSNN